jgi:hypothetical protein
MHRAFVLLLLILAACSAPPAATDVPFYTATPRELPGEDGEFMGTELPLEFMGGSPEILATGGSFSFTVSADTISQHNSGTVIYSWLPAYGAIPAHDQLYLAASDADSSEQISFEFSSGLPIGQYSLVAPADFIMGTVSAQYQRLVADDANARLEVYNQQLNGTFNLSVAGTMISGDFQFTAAYLEQSPTGEVQTHRVEISGTFANIPYYAAGDDPFDISVPLPTRIFSGTEVPVNTEVP